MIVKRYTPRGIAHAYDNAFREESEVPLVQYVSAKEYDALAARCAELQELLRETYHAVDKWYLGDDLAGRVQSAVADRGVE